MKKLFLSFIILLLFACGGDSESSEPKETEAYKKQKEYKKWANKFVMDSIASAEEFTYGSWLHKVFVWGEPSYQVHAMYEFNEDGTYVYYQASTLNNTDKKWGSQEDSGKWSIITRKNSYGSTTYNVKCVSSVDGDKTIYEYSDGLEGLCLKKGNASFNNSSIISAQSEFTK